MDYLSLIGSASDLDSLVEGQKSMMVFKPAGEPAPFCDLGCGDRVFFTTDNGAGFVVGQALVKDAQFLRKKNKNRLFENRDKLNFGEKEINQWSKKSNIMLVELAHARKLKPFAVNLGRLSVRRPWLPIDCLNRIRIS